jgi:hypothetical protein
MLSDIVITDHALSVLRGAELTGFEVLPAKLVELPSRVSPKDMPALWELTVTGKGGAADKASGIMELQRCSACGLVRYSAFTNGLIVDESEYDGSDFFVIKEYPKYVLVSSRAKLVIESSRLTNVEFVVSSRLQWPNGVAKPQAEIRI